MTGPVMGDGMGGERELLFHGTSAARYAGIVRDGMIRTACPGVPVVSLTTAKTVAAYFAALAADCDGGDMVTLVVDAAECRRRGVLLVPFEDDVWGEGECAWEREIAAWSNVPVECVVAVAGVAA